MSLLPVFLKLNGRPCLVVGAGEVATGKIESLVLSDAVVTVVAPWAKPEIELLAARGAITWHRREFMDSDIDGQFVVIAGTDVTPVNQHVYRLCDAAGTLCNAVDDIPHCDFYYGSVVSRGDLQIAISTAGESPSTAQKLKREIDAALPHDLGPWLHTVGKLRREVLAAYPASEERKSLLGILGERSVCEAKSCPSRRLALPHLHLESLMGQQQSTAHVPRAVQPKQDAQPSQNAHLKTVMLVGAGPGDPDLLTVKAARLLASADLLLHDDLVPPAILALAPPTAEIISVGKRCGRASITQAQIHELMIAAARTGRAVIRLKSGDPLLFGRAGEEMEALRAASIPFEVVPGVTAASAAAAAIPCSLTDRRAASGVLLTTGHTAEHTNAYDISAELTHAGRNKSVHPQANSEPTRIVYMPGRDLTHIAREWRASGLPNDYPCVLVSRAGQPDQKVTRTTLNLLHVTSPGAAPSLLMGGQVFAERFAAIVKEDHTIYATLPPSGAEANLNL